MILPLQVFAASNRIFEQAIYSPETGMGFHQIMVFAYNNLRPRIVTLVNNKYIFEFENYANLPLFLNMESLQVIPNFDSDISKISILTNSRFSANDTTSTLPPYTYYTEPGDMFIRLSAFDNDKRILADGSVLKGTYATTWTDMKVTPSGLAAVGRYALPNRLSAYYLYRIIPPVGTAVLFGTVTPNYGLCGGGVEVFFPDGCSKGSAFLYEKIPDK